MNKIVLKPVNVIDNNELPEMTVDKLAHKKVLFRNENGICYLEDCQEMIIS